MAVNQGRYTWRHNSLLYTICHYLNHLISKGYSLFADIEGYRNTSELFHRSRPDAALVSSKEIIIIELTCCFETNLINSRNYKKERYRNIDKDVVDQARQIKKVFVEISSLGFYTKHIKDLKSLCKMDSNINTDRLLAKLTEVAVRSSYYIFTQRNKTWNQPDILKFY